MADKIMRMFVIATNKNDTVLYNDPCLVEIDFAEAVSMIKVAGIR
jgi:hypothetical protein